MNVNDSSTQSYWNVYPHVRQDRRDPELSGENAEPDLESCSRRIKAAGKTMLSLHKIPSDPLHQTPTAAVVVRFHIKSMGSMSKVTLNHWGAVFGQSSGFPLSELGSGAPKGFWSVSEGGFGCRPFP